MRLHRGMGFMSTDGLLTLMGNVPSDYDCSWLKSQRVFMGWAVFLLFKGFSWRISQPLSRCLVGWRH